MPTVTLTRQPGESVLLILPDGRAVECRTVSARGNHVRQAFTAPADVLIVRREIACAEQVAGLDAGPAGPVNRPAAVRCLAGRPVN